MPIPIAKITPDQVTAILALNESHFVDLKACEISGASLSKTISAFANASGGEIYLGVSERLGVNGPERVWQGYPHPEAANAVLQVLESMAPLGNHYEAEFLSADGQAGFLLHITILKSREVLFATNKKAYVRRGAQKLPVEDDETLRRLRYDKGVSSFEDEMIDVDPSELSNSGVMLDFVQVVIPSVDPIIWLRKQRLTGDKKCTVSGTLLFSDEPQAILPKRSAIKLFRYRTKDEGERDFLAENPRTMEGPAYNLIFDAVTECKSIIETIEKLGPTGLEKVSYPEEALHEIVTNAVLHRDYSIAADIQIRIFDNRVEIESPGRLPGHVTTANILREQFARNPKLVRIINKFPNPPNKDVGEGLNTAFEAMEKLRLKPPIIEERENSVVLVLRHESLGSPEQLVMEYLTSHDEITNATGRELTGIKSENTMKEVFYRLRDRGLLEQVPGKLGNKAAWRKPLPQH